MTLQSFLQSLLNALPLMGRYALVTMGIVLIFRTTATTNFAQGLIGTFGAFTVTWATMTFTALPLWLDVIIGMAVAFVISVFVDTALIRVARHITPSGKQMITMGVMMIMVNLIPKVFSHITLNNLPGKSISTKNFQFLLFEQKLYIPINGLWAIGIALMLLAAIFLALKYTKWGLGVRATAANEMVAQMLGVNTRLITAFSWGLAGSLSAVGGFFTGFGTVLNTTLMANVQVFAFLACILGGFSSFPAPILGSVIIPLIYVFAGNPKIMGSQAGIWQNLVTFVVVLLLILIFPNGILGKKTIKKV